MPLTAIMVDLDSVRKAFACKDEALLEKVLDGSDLEDDDTDPDEYELEDDEDDFDSDEPEELPSSQDALRHIIMGEPWARGIAGKYGYVFMVLCRQLGEELDRTNWGQTRAEFDGAFDRVLAKLGVNADVIRLGSLMQGGGDFPLPKRFRDPSFSTMTATQAARAAAALGGVDRALLASQGVTTSRGVVEPEFVGACFDELHGWCQTCANAGKGLIIFYY